MKNIFVCLIIISTFSHTGFAQTKGRTDSMKIDTTKQKIKNKKEYFNNSDLFKSNDSLYKNNLQKPKSAGSIYLLKGNNLIYSNPYLNSGLIAGENSVNFTDRFAESKKYLFKLLELGYKNQIRYNLGKFGRYLGISKNVLAIILGIISLIK